MAVSCSSPQSQRSRARSAELFMTGRNSELSSRPWPWRRVSLSRCCRTRLSHNSSTSFICHRLNVSQRSPRSRVRTAYGEAYKCVKIQDSKRLLSCAQWGKQVSLYNKILSLLSGGNAYVYVYMWIIVKRSVKRFIQDDGLDINIQDCSKVWA